MSLKPVNIRKPRAGEGHVDCVKSRTIIDMVYTVMNTKAKKGMHRNQDADVRARYQARCHWGQNAFSHFILYWASRINLNISHRMGQLEVVCMFGWNMHCHLIASHKNVVITPLLFDHKLKYRVLSCSTVQNIVVEIVCVIYGLNNVLDGRWSMTPHLLAVSCLNL